MDYNVRTVIDIRSVNTPDELNPPIEDVSDLNPEKVLCLLCKNGRLGAAYYSIQEKTLYLYEEISDTGPQYLVSGTVYREVCPKYVLTFGNIAEEYVKVLIDMANTENNTTMTSNTLRLPENFFLVSLKDYSYDVCKTIISNINIASNTLEGSDIRQELYVHSLINLNHRLSIQALGALYKYLEKSWSLFGIDHGDINILHIYQVTIPYILSQLDTYSGLYILNNTGAISKKWAHERTITGLKICNCYLTHRLNGKVCVMKHHVLLDNSSFKALQIFSQRSHDAGFKRGMESSSREGLSIYKLLLSDCKSKIGQVYLRNLLLSPINDEGELKKRLGFIRFTLEPSNSDFIENIQNNIKQLRDVSLILGKIQNARASNRDWNTLHKIISHTIYINEISRPFRDKSLLLAELNITVTENLIGLQDSISNALDFNAGVKRGRPVIKFGLDENLDAKLLRQQDVAKHVTAAARFAVNDLPDFINECKVVYLPEMGHLMAIKEWEPNCDPESLQYLGYQLMFSLGGIIHYKNPLCVELDKRLGDINAEIIDHENRILRRLSAFALKYNKDIRQPIKIIALMDSLISMAKMSQHNNFVRPELNNEHIQEIEDCKHPLMEQILTSFESNSFYSGGPYSHMKIITGANGSGKSIYLKQIALVIYLAHIGCYVPAKKANIGLVSSIHCQMQATESASVRLSSFMIDIAQSSQTINYASPSSIILMDEFGRGTLDDDGLALLVSFLKNFLEREELCPHILVSTHLQRVIKLLPESKYLEYYKMAHTMENGTLCFLHKITKGVSKSYAFDIAATILNEDLIKTAKKYYDCLQNNKPIPLPTRSLQFQKNVLDLSVLPPDK